MNNAPKQPFRWLGSKVRMSSKIDPIIEQARLGRPVYVEPFGGSAAMLLALEPVNREVYNDADERLVDFFRALVDDESRAKLRFWGETLPCSRAIYDEMKRDWIKSSELAKRGFATFYVQAFSFGGKPFDTFGYQKTAGSTSAVATYWRKVFSLDALAKRFRFVNIERLDWRDVVDKYDSEQAFFYCDPPYQTPTSNAYKNDLRPVDHAELVRRLLTLRGGAALSCYDGDVYKPLREAGWERYDFAASSSVAHATQRTGEKGKRVETLYVKR